LGTDAGLAGAGAHPGGVVAGSYEEAAEPEGEVEPADGEAVEAEAPADRDGVDVGAPAGGGAAPSWACTARMMMYSARARTATEIQRRCFDVRESDIYRPFSHPGPALFYSTWSENRVRRSCAKSCVQGACSRAERGSHRLRCDGHRAVRVVQQGVGHPAELQAESGVPTPGADDHEVGGGRAVHQDPVRRTLDRHAPHPDLRILGHGVAQQCVEQGRGAPLGFRGGFLGLPGAAAPGADHVQGAAACLGLVEGDPRGRATGLQVTCAEQDPLKVPTGPTEPRSTPFSASTASSGTMSVVTFASG